MSNRRRLPRRPFSPAGPGEEVEIAFIPGATLNTEASIAAMQRRTHDGLIRMLGQRRRSGIRWRHIHGRAKCEGFLEEAYADSDVGMRALTEQYVAFVREHGDEAVLVVAECEAVR